MNYIADFLLEKGNSFYNKGRLLIKILLISLAIFALVLLIAFIGYGGIGVAYCLSLVSYYAIVNLLMGVTYVGILVGLVGIPLYFCGLHYLGLGQIAKNTQSPNQK